MATEQRQGCQLDLIAPPPGLPSGSGPGHEHMADEQMSDPAVAFDRLPRLVAPMLGTHPVVAEEYPRSCGSSPGSAGFFL
jgi:hypothetical protein